MVWTLKEKRKTERRIMDPVKEEKQRVGVTERRKTLFHMCNLA